jgi:hypothetical protein
MYQKYVPAEIIRFASRSASSTAVRIMLILAFDRIAIPGEITLRKKWRFRASLCISAM